MTGPAPVERHVHLPVPDPYTGPGPCLVCRGAGVTGDLYRFPVTPPTVILVDVFCPSCLGCGQEEHATCKPRQHADWRDQSDPGDDEDVGEVCPSCEGPGWWAVLGFPPGLVDGGEEDMVQLRVPCGCSEPLMVEVAPTGAPIAGGTT